MKSLRPIISALVLTMFLSTAALAGQIGGLRTAGQIGGLRTEGQIGAPRTAGQIGAPRANSAIQINQTIRESRFDLESTVAGLIRMLLDGGALL